MNDILMLLAIGVIFYFFVFKRSKSYFDLPQLHEYVLENPQCRTDNGIKCVSCGSKSIKNWGINGANSNYRVHICNHCGLSLYRS